MNGFLTKAKGNNMENKYPYMTQSLLDDMAGAFCYDITSKLYNELAPCEPGEFLTAYIELAPDFPVSQFQTDGREPLHLPYDADLRNKDDIDAIVAFAESLPIDRRNSLARCFRRLTELAETTGLVTYHDNAKHSFCWSAGGLFGGCIYHDDGTWNLHT